MKYYDFITEAWYKKHLKDNKTVVLSLNYAYGEDENDAHAQMYYDIYGENMTKRGQNFDIDYDLQGSAFNLFDKGHIDSIIEREVGYSEALDSYMEIDKIKYIKAPKKPKDTSIFTVECIVTLKLAD